MIDAIDPAQLRSIADIFWGGDSHSFLKIRTDLLLCYAFTCRGDNSRNLKISTVGYFTFKLGVKYFPDVGVNGIYILRSVWRKSKKNNFGHFEQTSLVRNVEVKGLFLKI
jgi:hypothetical protein